MQETFHEGIDEMEEELSTTTWLTVFSVLQVVLRVSFVITLWLLLFLTVFLGYLTLPVFFLLILAVFYASIRLQRWSRKVSNQIRNRVGFL